MLDTLTVYPTGLRSVNSSPPSSPPVPIKGRYFVRTSRTHHEAAFAGADFWAGRTCLVEPSLAQAAYLAVTTVSAVWWAAHREAHRQAILRGEMPLVPPRIQENRPLVPVVYDNGHILDFVRANGVTRVLDACVAIEAAQ